MKTTLEESFEETNTIELAVGSFIISTVLFTLYIVSNESSNVLVISWPFVASAIILNAIMLVHLINNFIKLKNQRKSITNKILILLINLPIVYLYYTIVMNLA